MDGLSIAIHTDGFSGTADSIRADDARTMRDKFRGGARVRVLREDSVLSFAIRS